MNGHEFKEKYNDIVDDIRKILIKKPFIIDEQNMIEILSLLGEIIKRKGKNQMNNQILQICLN